VATDASEEQIAAAEPADALEFCVARAEESGLESASVDLITVAQALHWFEVEAFFAEASRVLKRGGVLAFWVYHNCRVDPDCDEIIDAVFAKIDAFWPTERDIVENDYPDIAMPFTEIPTDEFSMTTEWTAENALNYMRTWSATRRYLAENGNDPCDEFVDELRSRWGNGTRTVSWPLILRVGRK